MNLRSLTFSVLFILEPFVAWARPTTPCDGASIPKTAIQLHTQLTQTDAPKTLLALANSASQQLEKSSNPDERGCLAYIAGSAHFVLSSKRSARVRHAAQALHYFLRAQSLSPTSMATRQPASRLKTAWKRLATPKGWPLKRQPKMTEVSTMPSGTRLVLRPPNDAIITEICGNDESCQKRMEWVIHPRADVRTSVTLRPGSYRVTRQSECGKTSLTDPIMLDGSSIPLPPPVPCSVRLVVKDGDSVVTPIRLKSVNGTVLKPNEITTETGIVHIEAPGYRIQMIKLKPNSREEIIQLKKCVVPVTVETTPQDARVQNAEPGPWGKRSFQVSRFGHETEVITIHVPRPESCANIKPSTIQVALKRSVTVRANDHEGKSVTPSRLVVDGHPVDVLGFHLRPGQYTFAAIHPDHGTSTGALVVTPCMAGNCKAEVLSFRFARSKKPKAPPSFWNGPRASYLIGSVILLSGLGVGLAAAQVNSDIQDYESKAIDGFPIRDLVEERDTYSNIADVLMLSGGLTITAGWVWSLAGDNP